MDDVRAVALGVSLLPGPAVVAVVSSALRGGFGASLRTNAGVLLGNAAFVGATALGLGALLVASHPLFLAVKWLGIAYLAYLGLRACWRAAVRRMPSTRRAPADEPSGSASTTQLANPKIVLFFGALLPQFVDPARPVALQFAILGATFIAGDGLVFAGYGALAHRARAWLRSPRAARVTSRVSGAAFLGVAAGLAAER